MLRALACVLVFTLACDRSESTKPEADAGKKREGGEKRGGGEPSDPNACRPANLETAQALRPLVLPGGCRLGQGGSLSAPLVVADAAGYASILQCDAGVAAPLAIDFATERLLVVSFSMSPAYAGLEALDEGGVVTFVQRDRSPCPDDPMPMPMNTTVAFVLAEGEARTYAQASCSVPARCK